MPPKFTNGVYAGRLYRHRRLGLVYHQECASIRGQELAELVYTEWTNECSVCGQPLVYKPDDEAKGGQ